MGFSAGLRATVAANLWAKWIHVAVEHARLAAKARADILEAPDGIGGIAIDEEFKASLVAVGSAAFAIDTWYIAVKDMVRLPPHLEKAWKENGRRPSRAGQVLESLKAGFKLGRSGAEWALPIGELFDLRNGVVHHEPVFRETVPHPAARTDVGFEVATYCLERAVESVDLAIEVVTVCMASPRPAHEDLMKWCADRAHVPRTLAEKRKAELGAVAPTS